MNMTSQLRCAFRAVVLPSPDAYVEDTPTRRLLGELGHDVARAASPDHAVELLNADHTDLLVMDITNDNSNRELLTALAQMEPSKRPEQIAVFSDSLDVELRDLRRRLAPTHLHVFFEPLHMHGLLNVLRHMEQQSAPSVD
jgi:response regulator RpfG family c-di-GMP phosphodiesterase